MKRKRKQKKRRDLTPDEVEAQAWAQRGRGKLGVYLQPVGSHDTDPFGPPNAEEVKDNGKSTDSQSIWK